MLRTLLASLFLAVLAAVAAGQDAHLDLGDSFSGSIDSAFDLDVVEFEAVAGTLLTAKASGKEGFHPSLTLVDLSTGEPVDVSAFLSGAGKSKVSIKKMPLPSTGGYQLGVGPGDQTLGGYKLTTRGKITKPLKSFKADGASEPGGGALTFAAMPGTKMTVTVKQAKGFTSTPDVPLLDGPGGPIDLAAVTTLTGGKVPKAKITAFPLAALGDYTLTPVEQAAAEGEAPPLTTTLKLTFPKVVKVALVEQGTFANVELQIVSQNTAGEQGSANSFDSSLSFDGHAIAFASHAKNLVPGAGGATLPANSDIFVRNLQTGTTVVASAPTGSEDGIGDVAGCDGPALDSSGTVVAFTSTASTLVVGDGNGTRDVFVRDLATLETTRVSVTSGGQEGHGDSSEPEISGDGRFVVFASLAADLVAGDGNGTKDIFLHDRVTHATTRISVSASGAEVHGHCSEPVISIDGLHVAFTSAAADLLPPGADTNGKTDIYVKDLATGAVQRASLTESGAELTSDVNGPSLSGDGRFVSFSSVGKFAAGDGNSFSDVFVKDLLLGTVDLASVGSAEEGGNNSSAQGQLSANGQLLVFRTQATNLVSGGDVNGSFGDILLRDRGAGTTVRVDLDNFGNQADNECSNGDISADGSHVAFSSFATNLMPGADLNNAYDVFVRF